MTKLYLNTSKSFTCPIECSLSPLMRALPLVSKPFFFQMDLAPSSKVQTNFFIFFILKWALLLVQKVWSIGSKDFIF